MRKDLWLRQPARMAVQLLQAMARQAKRNKRCRPAARAAAGISRPDGDF
jgi:hypothetical protein